MGLGCGDEADTGSGDPSTEGSAAITVTLDPDGPTGQQAEMTEEVNCEEATKDAACLAVANLEASDFDLPSVEQGCTELFGGPDIALIQGEINGEEVDAELNRSNGCEIERYEAAVPLLQALFEGYQPGGAIGAPSAG